MRHVRREPAPGILRLVLPLPFEGLRRVNAYVLLDGGDVTLVDCGIHDPAAARAHGWDDLADALGACGLKPQDVTRLVVTHPHADHYGMAARVLGAGASDLWMHEDAASDLERYRDPAAAVALLRQTLVQSGVAPVDVDDITAFEDWRPYLSGIVDATVEVRDGDRLKAGSRTWEMVHTPGHSPAHMCPWSARDGVLISGDHLLPAVTPHIDLGRRSEDPLGDYLSSLERIEKLAPALVLPGHGSPFEDGAERARTTLRHHDRRLGAILQVVRTEPKGAGAISDAIFGSALFDFQRRLAIGEIVAHLTYLERRNEVERVRLDAGGYGFRKAPRAQGERS